ncbi:MAG: guanine deaminase [Burkholderiaceae bacterium]|nr:guanine deaminase [Burkholderiaceae bacterium]
MNAYRAALLRFDDAGQPLWEADGLLLTAPDAHGVERVVASGAYTALAHRLAEPQAQGVQVTHWPGKVMAPGFVDMHVHYPQIDVIGSPADGLLPWLERYTFPTESRFADPAHAAAVAEVFTTELLRHGVTTALAFATSHPVSVDALFGAAQARGMRLVTGLCLMDQNAPDGVRNQAAAGGGRDATEHSLCESEALIGRWHGVDRLGYAITPRFVPTCSDAQLRGAGELATRFPSVWVQSHVAENRDEVAWVRELHPTARSYLDVYHRFGLLRERAVYAHCIYLDATDRVLLRDTGTAAAVCPTSNLFLGSGFFDFAAAQAMGFAHGLASDVGGGTSFSPFETMKAAYFVGRMALEQGGELKPGLSLSPARLWWLHTAGAAQALGLGGVVGNLSPGSEADFVVLDPCATPLLARRTAAATTLDEWLFAMVVLADDRAIEHVHLALPTIRSQPESTP